MNTYLSYRDIPEIQSVAEHDRAKTWRAFMKEHGVFRREFFLSFGPLFLLLIATSSFISRIGFIPLFIVCICGPFVSAAFFVSLIRKPLQRFLAKTT
jgi:hypothetical protein